MKARRGFLALAAGFVAVAAVPGGAAAQSFLRDAFGGAANRPRSGGPTIPRGGGNGGGNSSNGGYGGTPAQNRPPAFGQPQRPRPPRGPGMR
jgi:hypothetical protein